MYIGSFNSNRQISIEKNPNGKELFQAEQDDLLNDLGEIPFRSCDRKVTLELPSLNTPVPFQNTNVSANETRVFESASCSYDT